MMNILKLTMLSFQLFTLCNHNWIRLPSNIKDQSRVPCHQAIDYITGEIIGVCGNEPNPKDPVSYPSDSLVNNDANAKVEHVCLNGDLSAELRSFGITANNVYPSNNKCQILESKFAITEKNVIQYETRIVQSVVRLSQTSDLYAYLYRVVLSPKWVRHNGVFGIGSFGDNWLVNQARTSVNLNEQTSTRSEFKMRDYAPKRSPSENSYSIGIDSDLSISASVNLTVPELTIANNSEISSNKYDLNYLVKTVSSDYTKKEEIFYGMFTFAKTTSGAFNYLETSFTISYYGTEWYNTRTAYYNYVLKLCDIG